MTPHPDTLTPWAGAVESWVRPETRLVLLSDDSQATVYHAKIKTQIMTLITLV